MRELHACPACASMRHDEHTTVYPTGWQVPDPDPRRDRGRMIPELRLCECPACTA